MIIVAFVKNHNYELYTRDHDFTEQYSKIARFGIYHEID